MPIQILPPQLANQIAAGEVVERPASVVKELVENSLDSGATRIDIDIEKGGTKRIRVQDNGCGITKDELSMALSRHATSKISTLDDLEAIASLGFRGEALASISSVSRLNLTSRTASQSEAWQAYTEGREMAVTVTPAAHPLGTTLDVLDLFYNTPARRRFLRTEKTEFTHIDEVVRRIALARFDVSLTLTHNGNLIRQYRAVTKNEQRERRLGAICGQPFIHHALAIQWQQSDLSLHGWVTDPTGSCQITELQYCYVNGRIVRDKLINHAIRQAYQNQLTDKHQPAYVLYLHIDPHQVDVNVHPAKHEVRFHQSRIVHDFICQGVSNVLNQMLAKQSDTSAETKTKTIYWQPEARQAAQHHVIAASPDFSNKEGTRQKLQVPMKYTSKDVTENNTTAYHQRQCKEPIYQKQHGTLYQQLLPSSESAYSNKTVQKPDEPLDAHSQSFGRVLTIVRERYALLERGKDLLLLALPVAERWLNQAKLNPGMQDIKPQPLLIPLRLTLLPPEREAIERFSTLLTQLGMELFIDDQHATLRAVPLPLRQQNLQQLIPALLSYLAGQEEVPPDTVVQWLVRHSATANVNWAPSQAIALLADIERICPMLITSPPDKMVQWLNIDAELNTLEKA